MDRDHRGFMNRNRTGFKHAEHAAGVLEGPIPFFGHCLGFVSLHVVTPKGVVYEITTSTSISAI